MKKVIFVLSFFAVQAVFADECFVSSGDVLNDAQTIRKTANAMGWKVGKLTSMAAGSVIKGKTILYPQDNVDVCLKEESELLYIRAQSAAIDAGKAEYRKLPGQKKPKPEASIDL